MQRYPFTALVGHDRLKTAYLANIVNPEIGGLLIAGVKGTGKSTLVRSVEAILPEYSAVADCPFNCDPSDRRHVCSLCMEKETLVTEQRMMRVVNLPLSTSEDRLIGSVEIEKLLKTGEKDIQVGILGQANRNILYIDEVNLLPDHIVDDILDAAASHWNTIEREGFSISHPADFVLIGTMNPEEGDLRPQILDRFPLSVMIKTITDPKQRVDIVKRNLMFDADPERFLSIFNPASEQLKARIIEAREMLPGVTIDEESLMAIAGACSELKVDGQRPDIVIVRVARTTAALERRLEVDAKDILLGALLTLIHRTRDGGLLGPPSEEEISTVFQNHLKKMTHKHRDWFKPDEALQNWSQAARAGVSDTGLSAEENNEKKK